MCRSNKIFHEKTKKTCRYILRKTTINMLVWNITEKTFQVCVKLTKCDI